MTAILATFLLLGHLVMVAFGISIPGIRIAGGMVIGFLGFAMLVPEESQITRLHSTPATKRRSNLIPTGPLTSNTADS